MAKTLHPLSANALRTITRKIQGLRPLITAIALLLCTSSFAGTPVSGTTTFDEYNSGFVDLTGGGTSKAGSAGLSALNVDGYDFTLYSDNNSLDCGIGIEPFTGQTPLVYGYSSAGLTSLTALDVSSNGLKYFDLSSVDLIWDGSSGSRNVTLTGYRNGNPVASATLTLSMLDASDGQLLVNFNVASNTAFHQIDKFRVEVQGTGVYAIGVDNINALNFSGTVLPLALISFDGHPTGHGVELTWVTASEVNTAGFDLEKAGEDGKFNLVASLPATVPGASGQNTYRYTDAGYSGASNLHYRLKMKDRDGKFSYSHVITIKPRLISGSFLIYPNPVKDGNLKVLMKGDMQELQASIVNMAGTVLVQKKLSTSELQGDVFNLNIRDLPAGFYFLRIIGTANNKTKMLSFIK